MSAVIDRPHTAKRSVRLGQRVVASRAGFYWYQAGKQAAHRDTWMEKARAGDERMRALRVRYARDAHHEYLRQVRHTVAAEAT